MTIARATLDIATEEPVTKKEITNWKTTTQNIRLILVSFFCFFNLA